MARVYLEPSTDRPGSTAAFHMWKGMKRHELDEDMKPLDTPAIGIDQFNGKRLRKSPSPSKDQLNQSMSPRSRIRLQLGEKATTQGSLSKF